MCKYFTELIYRLYNLSNFSKMNYNFNITDYMVIFNLSTNCPKICIFYMPYGYNLGCADRYIIYCSGGGEGEWLCNLYHKYLINILKCINIGLPGCLCRIINTEKADKYYNELLKEIDTYYNRIIIQPGKNPYKN